jgi:hypothetical protein
MRVCPKCGFEDEECWRNLRFSLYQQYCHIEELDTFNPELASEILKFRPTVKKPYTIDGYAYMLTKSLHVRRMAVRDFINYGGFRREAQSYGNESWRYAQRIDMATAQTSLEQWTQ